MSDNPSADEWRKYLNAETELLLAQVGNELLVAFVHSRMIEEPEFYGGSMRAEKDLARAHFGMTKAGYWERIAMRAVFLLTIPAEDRQAKVDQLVKEAAERMEAIKKKLRKVGRADKRARTSEVDITKIRL